ALGGEVERRDLGRMVPVQGIILDDILPRAIVEIEPDLAGPIQRHEEDDPRHGYPSACTGRTPGGDGLRGPPRPGGPLGLTALTPPGRLVSRLVYPISLMICRAASRDFSA